MNTEEGQKFLKLVEEEIAKLQSETEFTEFASLAYAAAVAESLAMLTSAYLEYLSSKPSSPVTPQQMQDGKQYKVTVTGKCVRGLFDQVELFRKLELSDTNHISIPLLDTDSLNTAVRIEEIGGEQ